MIRCEGSGRRSLHEGIRTRGFLKLKVKSNKMWGKRWLNREGTGRRGWNKAEGQRGRYAGRRGWWTWKLGQSGLKRLEKGVQCDEKRGGICAWGRIGLGGPGVCAPHRRGALYTRLKSSCCTMTNHRKFWFLGMVGKEVGEAVLAPAGDLFVLELGSENKVDGLLNGCLRWSKESPHCTNLSSSECKSL